jgi:ATP-binding cassette subfamily G (WHITE) protein 2 (PDR)
MCPFPKLPFSKTDADFDRNFGIIFAFIFFNIFLAILTYYLFRVANLSNLTAKFHKTKGGAKAKGTADKAAEGVQNAAQQGAHPGERNAEKGAA